MSAPRRTTRLAVGLCTALVVASCAKKDRGTTDSAAGAVTSAGAPAATPAGPSAPPAAPPIAITDVAGRWAVVAVPTTGADTAPTNFTLVISAPNNFKQTFANGQVVTPKAVLAGDSIVSDAGPYPSVRRKGMKVVTHSVMRKQGDMLVGTTTAHYQGVKTGDSVLTLRLEGTKKP